MSFSIVPSDQNHFLESMEAGSKEKIVIRGTKNAEIVSINPATKFAPSENVEDVIHVNTIEDSTEDCPLTYAIHHGENIGELANPSDIGHLIHVDEH